ncbi:MAG: hypothetical protein AAB354_16815 [candidate division KSB1 bacterium]
MLTVKGLYDGKRVEFLEPIPRKHARKKALVIITFLEEEKVPRSTKRAVQELAQGKLLNLNEVLRAV